MRRQDQEPEEMEDWMQTWQQSVEPIDALREDFVRRSRQDVWGANALVVFLCAGLVGLLALAIARASWLPILALVIVGPYGAYGAARIYRITRFYRSAPPLTPRGYIEAMRLHLEVRRRHHSFDQSMFPLSVLLPALLIALLIYLKGPSIEIIGMLLCVAAPGYAYAFYSSFYKTPRELEAERQRLDELERELLD